MLTVGSAGEVDFDIADLTSELRVDDFATADDGPELLIRDKPVYDGAQPSGNSVTALNLLRLHTFTTDDRFAELAERTIFAFGQTLIDGALETPKLAIALDYYHDEAKEIVVVGDGPTKVELQDVLRTTFLPNRAWVIGEAIEAIPWTADKRPMAGRPTAYVCLQQVCKKPTSDPTELAKQLADTVTLKEAPLELPESGSPGRE